MHAPTYTHLCKCEYIHVYIYSLIKTRHAHVCLSRSLSLSLSLTLRERQSAVRCVFHRAKIFKFSKFCGGSLNIYLVWHWAASTCYVKHFVCFGLFLFILQSPLIASAVISWGKEPAQKPSNCNTLWVFHANLKVSARCHLTHRSLSLSLSAPKPDWNLLKFKLMLHRTWFCGVVYGNSKETEPKTMLIKLPRENLRRKTSRRQQWRHAPRQLIPVVRSRITLQK